MPRNIGHDMITNDQEEALNRTYGYETAVLLMDRALTMNEICSQLSYEEVNETQVDRIIRGCLKEDIIKVVSSKGTDEFILKKDNFSQEDLKEINEKAVARMEDPAEVRNKSSERTPDRNYVEIDRGKREYSHADNAASPSLFEENEEGFDVSEENEEEKEDEEEEEIDVHHSFDDN